MPILGTLRYIKRASDFWNGSVLSKYVYSMVFRSNLCNSDPLVSRGEGKKAGSTDCQLKWNSEETLFRKLGWGHNMTPSGKTVQYGSLQENAAISKTRLAKTTAVRNTFFNVRKYIELTESGKNGDLNNTFSTNGKSHLGNMGQNRARILMATLRNMIRSWSLAQGISVNAASTKIWTLMVF